MSSNIKNPYEVLAVDRNADLSEIKTAYRQLAKKHHPDRNAGNKESEERFKEISEAYAILRDPASRENYDRYGHQTKYQQPDFSTVDWQTIFNEADININLDNQSEMPRTNKLMFKFLFGAVNKIMRQSGLLPGETKELNIKIDLNEARAGTSKKIRIPGPSICSECKGQTISKGLACQRCQAQGFIKSGEEIELNIPRLVKQNAKLRLKGMGGPGTPPGDAIVNVNIKIPRTAKLIKNDIHIDLPVTRLELSQAKLISILGVDFKLDRTMQDGQIIHIQGAGIAGGDLVVKIVLNTWQGIWRNIKSRFSNTLEVI